MAAFAGGKAKRKGLDDVCDDFSDFSLSSPARKIRRLDVELPSIMEEEGFASAMGVKQQPATDAGIIIVDAPVAGAANEERALVLYRPVDAPQLLLSPGQSSASFCVSSDFIHGLKSQVFLGKNHYGPEERSAGGQCLAVVPWVPAQADIASHFAGEPQRVSEEEEEPMEAEEIEPASMELEEEQGGHFYIGGAAGSEGFRYGQNHCMALHPRHGPPSSPLMW